MYAQNPYNFVNHRHPNNFKEDQERNTDMEKKYFLIVVLEVEARNGILCLFSIIHPENETSYSIYLEQVFNLSIEEKQILHY